MPIIGIGTDIIKKERIARLVDKFGIKFARRILTAYEQERATSLSDVISYYAKRFAAKEAFSKAVGTGIGQHIGFQDISIINNPLGKPEISLSNKANNYLSNCYGSGNFTIHLSISDDHDYAIAYVIIEKM